MFGTRNEICFPRATRTAGAIIQRCFPSLNDLYVGGQAVRVIGRKCVVARQRALVEISVGVICWRI